jgi:hypothetical protein
MAANLRPTWSLPWATRPVRPSASAASIEGDVKGVLLLFALCLWQRASL